MHNFSIRTSRSGLQISGQLVEIIAIVLLFLLVVVEKVIFSHQKECTLSIKIFLICKMYIKQVFDVDIG